MGSEINAIGILKTSASAEGNIDHDAHSESYPSPGESKTQSMCDGSLHGNREIPSVPAADGAMAGRRRSRAARPTCTLREVARSHTSVKPPNKDGPKPLAKRGRTRTDQMEYLTDGRSPDTERDWRVDRTAGSASLSPMCCQSITSFCRCPTTRGRSRML